MHARIRPAAQDVLFSAKLFVLDRVTERPLDVTMEMSAPMEWLSKDPSYLPNLVRRLLQNILLHELDECLEYKGILYFDPHAPPKI